MKPVTRRLAAGQFACIGAGVTAPAALGTAATDPHVEWERQLEALRVACAGKEPGPLDEEMFALEDRIAETPARTMAGVMVQLRLARQIAIEEEWDSPGAVALRGAVGSLEELTVGRA